MALQLKQVEVLEPDAEGSEHQGAVMLDRSLGLKCGVSELAQGCEVEQ